jgi:acyl-CoA synthetase (AMP-forming)/AMP-acid ligase II
MYGDMIAFWAKQNPDAVALVDDVDISYRTFDLAINKVATRLAKLNLSRPALVAVQMRGLAGFYLIERALDRMGLTSLVLPLTPPGEFLDLLKPDLFLTISEDFARATPNTVVLTDAWFDEALKGPPVAPPGHRPHPDDLVRLLVSSGTTGRPKVIPISRRSFDLRNYSGVMMASFASLMRLMPVMGPSSLGGFTGPLRVWSVGGTVTICSSSELYRDVIRLCPDHITISPGQLEDLLEDIPPDFPVMNGLQITLAGSQVSRALVERTKRRLTEDVWIAYGSTEIGAASLGPASILDRHERAVGYVWPKLDIEVVGPDGAALAPRQVGVVRMRGEEGVFSGYLEEDEAASSPWRDGWFYPGDLGALTEDGLLIIEGRVAEIMNLGGVKIDPGAIDEVAKTCPGVADAAAFAVTDEAGVDWPWIAVVRSENYDTSRLIALLQAQWPALRALRVAAIDAIPRNGMAKVERHALKRMVVEARKARPTPPDVAAEAGLPLTEPVLN